MREGADAFVAELKRWRDVRSISQARLGREMRYDRSYVSEIESGVERPSFDFAAKADEIPQAGGAIKRAYRETDQHRPRLIRDDRRAMYGARAWVGPARGARRSRAEL